jgi:hypothetical protein
MPCQTTVQVTGIAIRLAISKKKFSIGDIQSELNQSVEISLIRQILFQLETDGWIEETGSSSLTFWQSGTLARRLGDTVRFSKEEEGTVRVLPDEVEY